MRLERKVEAVELAGEVRVELLADGGERAVGRVCRPLVVAEEELRQAALVVGAQEDVADGLGWSVVKVVT